jgi:hypothetical protein
MVGPAVKKSILKSHGDDVVDVKKDFSVQSKKPPFFSGFLFKQVTTTVKIASFFRDRYFDRSFSASFVLRYNSSVQVE